MAAAPRPAYFLGGSTPPNAGTSSTSTTSTGSAATTTPAAPFDWAAFAKQMAAPVDYAGLAKIASGRAAADTGALVAGYKQLQDSAIQQASARAAQEGQLGLASSRYLQSLNLGGAAAGDYAHAAAAQRAAAAGYSGGLQQTVGDAAAAVQAHLDAAGSPQHALNTGAAAGNALYGLGGNLPAEQLDAIGPTVAAGLRALPAQTLGYGQTLALGQLGAGQQEAAKYGADIVTAQAKQGALAASYLDKLSTAAQRAGQDRLANFYKMASLQQRDAAATAKAAQINPAVSKLTGFLTYNDGTRAVDAKGNPVPVAAGAGGLPKYQTFGDTLYEKTPGGLVPVATKPPTPTHLTTVSDAGGTYTFNPITGERGPKIAGPSASSANGSSYQDAYGREVHVSPDGKQTVISEGRFTNPVTKAVSRVTTDGKFIPLTPGKPTVVKPYKIPSGVYSNAVKIATTAFGGGTATNSILGALGGAASSGPKPYDETLRRVSAYLRGSGVPEKLVGRSAKSIMVSAGYTPGEGFDPFGWIAQAATPPSLGG